MPTGIKYYLVEGIASADPEKNLKSRLRIIAIPDHQPFFPKGCIPHESLRHIRKYEKRWQQLKRVSSKTADKICEKRFVLDFANFITTPCNDVFDQYSFDLLKHTIQGDYDNDFNGLHLISEFNKDVISVEELKPKDGNGVWIGKVVLYNEKRNKHYTKISSFFPRNWTADSFMLETYSAICTLKIDSLTEEYKSKTSSGVPVTIIIRNGRAKTIYPEYQEAV